MFLTIFLFGAIVAKLYSELREFRIVLPRSVTVIPKIKDPGQAKRKSITTTFLFGKVIVATLFCQLIESQTVQLWFSHDCQTQYQSGRRRPEERSGSSSLAIFLPGNAIGTVLWVLSTKGVWGSRTSGVCRTAPPWTRVRLLKAWSPAMVSTRDAGSAGGSLSPGNRGEDAAERGSEAGTVRGRREVALCCPVEPDFPVFPGSSF